jgi:hypothetical protein
MRKIYPYRFERLTYSLILIQFTSRDKFMIEANKMQFIDNSILFGFMYIIMKTSINIFFVRLFFEIIKDINLTAILIDHINFDGTLIIITQLLHFLCKR